MAGKEGDGHSRSSSENVTTLGSRHGLKTVRGPAPNEGVGSTRKSKTISKAHGVFENTYRTEPAIIFKSGPVGEIMKETLERSLSDKIYERTECAQLAIRIADEIKLRVKKLDYKRYKIVCLVTIGERKDQNVIVTSRCLWSRQHDNCASVSYANLSLFASATLFAIYFE